MHKDRHDKAPPTQAPQTPPQWPGKYWAPNPGGHANEGGDPLAGYGSMDGFLAAEKEAHDAFLFDQAKWRADNWGGVWSERYASGEYNF